MANVLLPSNLPLVMLRNTCIVSQEYQAAEFAWL